MGEQNFVASGQGKSGVPVRTDKIEYLHYNIVVANLFRKPEPWRRDAVYTNSMACRINIYNTLRATKTRFFYWPIGDGVVGVEFACTALLRLIDFGDKGVGTYETFCELNELDAKSFGVKRLWKYCSKLNGNVNRVFTPEEKAGILQNALEFFPSVSVPPLKMLV